MGKKTKLWKRWLSLLLAVYMTLSNVPFDALAQDAGENPWEGRSAVFVGDSITAGSGTTEIYYQFLEQSLGFGSVTAMGVAGSCISAASDYGQANQPLISRYQNIPSADLIMIFMGTNDYGHETPLGTEKDSQDGTFYGALNTIIPDLVAKHTSSKIVFVTPLHRYGFGTSKILGTQFTSDSIPNGVGATLGDYVEALKSVCASNGVSVIDLYTEYTLDPTDSTVREQYMPDGLHPNAAGHEVIAEIMESHIRGFDPVEKEPVELPEMIQGNKFAAGNNQPCRASSRINYYLKAGTVITLKNPTAMQWACAKTSDENSSNNLGYFPDGSWSDKETAVVESDGWVGFTFKYRDETQAFDLTKPLSDFITIEEPKTWDDVDTDALYNTITVAPGQLVGDTGEILENEIYGYVVNYPLKKGHILSISDSNYVFSVRKLENGNYSNMLKQATTASFTATEDMTVGCLIRKPDKSALTAEELANVVLYDSQFGMIGVEGSVHRFTVEAETIDGGTATTRAAIFLPDSYSESGTPTRLIIMTNGRHAYLTDSVWNGNSTDDVGVMRHYLDNDYAVLIVNNTADQVNGTDDWGNPQLVSSYWKAYDYVQENLNVEKLFSIHSRSMGTFAAVRMMREHPELVKCAVMCGPVLSLKSRFANNPAFMAKRYGFDDTTGATWEADKVVGYDPYTDADGIEYDLPPTFWMMAEADAISMHLTTIEKIKAHGNDVTTALYTETDHSGVCRLNIEACRTDSLAFLEGHQESTAEHRFCAWEVTKAATCTESGAMGRVCADCSQTETMELAAIGYHTYDGVSGCVLCGCALDVVTEQIQVVPGQLDSNSNGKILDSEIYGSIVNYSLKKGHTLSISDENYVFSVRVLANGSYSTMLKAATVDSFTATEDMTIGCLIRKPDKSALTAEELAGIFLVDTAYEEAETEIAWEIGTIAAASGQNSGNTTRLRTVDYLKLADYNGVTVNSGYTITYFAYDAAYNYLGNGSSNLTGYWLGSGIGITSEKITSLYENAVYFRLALRTMDSAALTLDAVADSGIRFYGPEEEIPVVESELTQETLMSMTSGQDGTVYGGKVFNFNASGNCTVYDLAEKAPLGSFTLDKTDVLKPHANSVCFSDTFYAPGDQYPLLYVNIYNNYSSVADRMEGTCCVYRVTETGGTFASTLVQVVRIGFTEDLTLWKSRESNGDVRPYGNFSVDTDSDKLYAFTMRDADKSTRFFRFALPAVTAGTYNETYGCNVVTLESADIEARFDMVYFHYIQGCCYADGKVLSVEGFGSGSSAEPALRIIDLSSQAVEKTIYLSEAGLTGEPEMISVADGTIYYAMADGVLRTLTIDGMEFEASEPKEPLAGKTISILGDSISTFSGVSNNTSYNSTIGSNAVYYSSGTLGISRADTWWQQTIDALDLELLVNNSWSGSCILHTRRNTVGAYVDRCVQLHNDQTGEEPDIIAVFLGTNDFSYYQSALGTADIDYDTLITDNGDGTYTYATPTTSCEAYAIMLHKMTERYPDADIYCMNLMARRDPDKEDNYADVGQPTAFNAELAKIITRYGVTLVDLENCGIDKNAQIFDIYIGDQRVHPGPKGMDKMTQALIDALMGQKNASFTVDFDLTNVTADASGGIVLSGEPFSAELIAAAGFEKLNVTVTMSGTDITASAYTDGKIAISAVTGDVVITATAEIDDTPDNYRWELCGGDLACIEGENSLTKQAGTVSNGVISNAYFQLEKPVILRHGQPWVVEWKASGSWSGMLFSANKSAGTTGNGFLFKTTSTSGFVGFGERANSQYENYGVALTSMGVDTTAEHTYRIENRVAADGSNMAYLLVDGVEIGSMNNFFIGGSSDQGKTVDWLNGRDLCFNYVGASGHTINNCAMEYLAVWEGGKPEEPLSGKTISILGASISTYEGTSNGAAADTTNSTIRNNVKYYPNTTIPEVELTDTWWMQVCSDMGLRLLVNNAWSGSSLLHERNGTVGAYVDRCVRLHDDTGDNAGETPDIIGIQMGTNDFQYYKDTLGTADIDYDALITANGDGTYTYATPVTSLEAAAIVLHKISVRYPDAEVYYLNISQRIDGTDELIQSLNAELKQVVAHFGAHIVDIYGSAITMEDFDTYIGDGRVHPNKLGMDAYTEAFKRALIASTGYTVTTHTVSLELDGVTADYGDDKIVVSSDAYTVKLTAADTLEVSVTMGGEDITESAYENGTVTIGSVTDDVVITAKSVHEPKNYRWEFNGTDLAGENTLSKLSGTTTEGVFSNTSYALAQEVLLLHDQPWVVEWVSEGTFQNSGGSTGARIFTSDKVNANYNARYIFKSNKNGIVAMGEKDTKGSHNYGIALGDHGIDWTAEHTYRLENRIADDGSNMIYLFVDGKEIGPMNHYYVGTTDKGTTSDWLSGKDFRFPYMGTDTHGFTNCSIDFIAVWEGGHTHSYESIVTAPTCTEKGYTTYTCTICGGSYVDGETEATGHSYAYAVEKEPTLTEEGALTGACTVCGEETTVELPKLDELVYTYAVTKEPTYTETGTATYTWKEEAYGTITITVVLEKREILYGDVNGDGEVTGKDRTILARYLAEWDGYTEEDIDLLAADVNQDGEVTGKDRTILARHLAEWIGYEELPYTG